MSLTKYKQKRNFKDTPEPEGKVGKEDSKLIFVVQRHHASHLHYDFRLELNGTLKSWAVPKGPSLNPADKRLAMMVEDHPISYATFEGDIPEGNYGAGHVDVWDHGTYEPVNEKGEVISTRTFSSELKKGSIKFRMKGRKLKGEFALVKIKKDESNSWLLIKHRDAHATDEDYNSENYAKKSSLKYTEERLGKKTAVKKKSPRKSQQQVKQELQKARKLSDYISPMLAKLHDEAFDNEDWVYELKWDGYRAIAEINRKNRKLYSRNGLSFEDKYPQIFEALTAVKKKVVLDGEVVVFDEHGKPSFQALQQFDPANPAPIVYYVFDVLYINGKSVEDKTLLERKALLKELLPENDFIKYCDHIQGKGITFFNQVKKAGMEGMIAKNGNSIYKEGVRTNDWLKIKHMLTDEAVIAGYTAPRGSRKRFGALVLGTYEKGKLVYIGHTGTGFNEKALKEVYQKMQPLVTDENPFGKPVRINSPVTWVKPQLVCNLKYTEVTSEGNRRHPVFMGLREDKLAKDVKPEIMAKPNKAPAKTAVKKTAAKKTTAVKKAAAKKATKQPAEEEPAAAPKTKTALTNLNKVYWPDEGYTKGDVIRYYESVYKYIASHIKGKPQSLLRMPNGIKGPAFFHKDAGENAPDWLDTYPVYSDSAGKTIDYLVCNNKDSLLYIANLGCIEINPWNSRAETHDKPDFLVMDLDPSAKNTFDEVVECALVIKEIFDKVGADCYCKTSGATGLHVYVPLGARYDYEQARSFAELIAHITQEQLPDTTTLERSLSKRKKHHIYIDYLQNKEGATLSCAYSLRPKPGAPVSTPLEWKEVKPGLKPADFNINNTLQRIEKKGDLFLPTLKKGIDIGKVLKKLGA